MPKELICPDKLYMYFADTQFAREEDTITYDEVCKMINDFPRLAARPDIKGKWIKSDYPDYGTKCSVCNQRNAWGEVNFCPWCGADMRGATPDYVPVIRCRDCRNFNNGICCDMGGLVFAGDDDYCPYGERRAENE